MRSENLQISFFAKTNFRSDYRLFGIYQHDRMMHTQIIGKTGAGKTSLIETLFVQDILWYRGACIFDIAGDLTAKILGLGIAQKRLKDVILLDTSDPNVKLGYNPLRKVKYEYRHLIASHILEVFEKTWGAQSWGSRIEYTLRNVLLTLLDQEKATLADIPKLLTDEGYRNQCIRNIVSKEILNFWQEEFPKYSKADILPVLSKVGGFLTIPIVKKILCENSEQISMSEIVNNQKILIVNISKGSIGRDAAHLLGSLIIGTIASVGFNRTTLPESKRKPFFVYLDEFQNYTTLTLVEMFSELRKFKIGFVVAHQYLNQLPEKIRDSVMGNVGTMICFRLSYQDAQFYAKEFFPVFDPEDFINLENHHIYLKLMIDGKPSHPFSAITVTPEYILLPKSTTIE